MHIAPNQPTPAGPDRPSRMLVLSIYASLIGVLLTLLVALLAAGPHFDSFPGRTIGISLLSDIDPHYRTGLYLLLAAAGIATTWLLFTLRGASDAPAHERDHRDFTLLVAAVCAANAALALLHPERELFLAASGLGALLFLLWWLGTVSEAGLSPDQFLLRLGLAWQLSTLLFWLAGIAPSWHFYGLLLPCYLAGSLLLSRAAFSGKGGRLLGAALATALLAPVLLAPATEAAYFLRGTEATGAATTALFALLLAACGMLAWWYDAGTRGLAWLAGLAVLLTTVIVNEYASEILYRGYDVFHLAEKILPLQQWDDFHSLPFIDYHPGHGLFDLFPHTIYHLLNGGNPLEALIWGNGYFRGWTMRALYIGLFYTCLARVAGNGRAFILLWLLPVYHILEPYNTPLLLPALHLLSLPGTRRPVAWWSLQWLITLGLALWRSDFGLIVGAGNVVVMIVMAWYRRQAGEGIRGVLGLAPALLVGLAAALLLPGERDLWWLLERGRDLMSIQMLAASYDHFYQEWTRLASMQYIVMPVLGVVAGGYALSRLFLRQAGQQLAIHLLIVFLTAIGFALSIRLFQRHSVVEGFITTNFFYFTPLLALWTLRIRDHWRVVAVVTLVTLAFITTPKTQPYRENTPWNPRLSYPVTTHPANFPPLATRQPRLRDKADRYQDFRFFSRHFLRREETFYDLSNAPLLYMLAGVRLPVYVYEAAWHTSEAVQQSTLEELERLRSRRLLPFVVFRQNKTTWDALDGVDNALRSYRMAEYVYRHYRPCARLDNLDIWLEKRLSCQRTLKRRLPQQAAQTRNIELLERNYLEQDIAFRHLPFIWANFDSLEDPVSTSTELRIDVSGGPRMNLTGDFDRCRGGPCYLDLTVTSDGEFEIPVLFSGRRQLSFTVRPGRQIYRIRISALWRWHEEVASKRLELQLPAGVSVERAALVELQNWPPARDVP